MFTKRIFVTSMIAGSLIFSTAACSGKVEKGEAPTPSKEVTSQPEAVDPNVGTTPPTKVELVGEKCSELPSDGPGSIKGVSASNILEATSNIPTLQAFTSANSGGLNPNVNFSDVLKTGGPFTVFAPTNEAFDKLDPTVLENLKTDDSLANILTYHILPSRVTPDNIGGVYTSVQGQQFTVEGKGNNIMINDAKVVCGGIKTDNATLYLIDKVLDPPVNMEENID